VSKDESRFAQLSDGQAIPFEGREIEERVVFHSYNYYSDKSPHGAVYPGGSVEIYFNNFQVYFFKFSQDLQWALTKAADVLDRLHYFPVPKALYGREATDSLLVNRPVYYREMPAVVEEFLGQHGKVRLRAVDERGFPTEPWIARMAGMLEYDHKLDVDLLSNLIWWFRESDED